MLIAWPIIMEEREREIIKMQKGLNRGNPDIFRSSTEWPVESKFRVNYKSK